MKKIYSYAILLFVAALMVASPAVAQTSDPAVTETDNVWMKKTVKDNQDGSYTINLQTYVKGSGEIVTSIAPADIAMVLDFSSSMVSNTITMNLDKEYKERLQTGSVINTGCTNEVYMAVINDTTYYGKLFEDNNKYYIPLKAGGVPSDKDDRTNSRSLTWGTRASGLVAYTVKDTDEVYLYCAAGNNKTVSRLMGLQIACSKFIETMYNNPPTGKFAGEHHKISIMPFSNSTNTTTAQVLTELTSANLASMKNQIANIAYSTGTRADLGMENAKTMFEGLPDNPDRKRITLFFTDGVPTNSGANATDFNIIMGAQTVMHAYTIKHDCGAIIYSVALLSGTSNKYEPIYVRRYLNFVSSNYPDKNFAALPQSTGTDSYGNPVRKYNEDSEYFNYGAKLDGTDGSEAPHDYYQLTTGSTLSDIFEQIAKEAATGGATVEVDGESSVVLDVISEQFRLKPGVKPSDIHLYTCSVDESHTGTTVKWESGSHDGENWVEWKPWTDSDPITNYININGGAVDVETAGDFLQVTGFDFADNYVGPIMNGSGTAVDGWHGKKLIIEFDIEADPSNLGGLSLNTNEPASGLYVNTGTKENPSFEMLEDNGESAKFQIPEVHLPYIKITAEGLDVGESAVYHIKQVKDAEGNTPATPFTTTVVVTKTDKDTDPFAIVKLITTGDYEITQETWSWEYGTVKYWDPVTETYVTGNKQTQHLATVGALTEDNRYLNYKFKNEDETETIPHAEAAVTNNMTTGTNAPVQD